MALELDFTGRQPTPADTAHYPDAETCPACGGPCEYQTRGGS